MFIEGTGNPKKPHNAFLNFYCPAFEWKRLPPPIHMGLMSSTLMTSSSQDVPITLSFTEASIAPYFNIYQLNHIFPKGFTAEGLGS